jgi:hypothetical protein
MVENKGNERRNGLARENEGMERRNRNGEWKGRTGREQGNGDWDLSPVFSGKPTPMIAAVCGVGFCHMML